MLLPPGQCSFDLKFAGIVIRILDLPTTWKPFVADRYGLFAEEAARNVAPDLQVQCREGKVEGLPIPREGEPSVVRVAAMDQGRIAVRPTGRRGGSTPGRGAARSSSRAGR